MKKNSLQSQKGFGLIALIAVLAVAVVIGGGVYKWSKKRSVEGVTPTAYVLPPSGVSSTTTSPAASNSSGKMTLKGLFALGKNTQCTFSKTGAEGKTSGTVYINGTNMRGDFVTTPIVQGKAQKEIDAHMIRVNSDVYVWSSDQIAQGLGIKISVANVLDAESKNQSFVNSNEPFDYTCADWSPDATKFVLPTTIKFTDFSKMMGGAAMSATATVNAQGSVKGAASSCSSCDKLPAEAKSQCRVALKCQ
ncbi:MAG: hypothetical protein RL094_709 [Candidatus Parcubacteria bacterium]|jgi:hypothetical protein